MLCPQPAGATIPSRASYQLMSAPARSRSSTFAECSMNERWMNECLSQVVSQCWVRGCEQAVNFLLRHSHCIEAALHLFICSQECHSWVIL